MRDEFRSSRERRNRQYHKTCALFEHQYEVEIEDSKWKKVAEDMERYVMNFYNPETLVILKKLPQENWLFRNSQIVQAKDGLTALSFH
jgi:hypothetical protein